MCEVKHCRQKDEEVHFYGRAICHKHWTRHCDENDSFNLKEEFNIKEE